MDEQDLTAQFKVTRNDRAVPSLESIDLEPKDIVSSNLRIIPTRRNLALLIPSEK